MSYWDEITISTAGLRAIIEGRRSFRKCPTCHGRGYVWCYENEVDAVEANDQTGDEESWYIDRYKAQAVWQEGCENCDTVGYVVAVWED